MNPKDVTVYMIGNAHIDPVWLWRWQEGLAQVLATCRSALDRMDEFPEFVFTRADAATYRWIEDACPEMFEEIRQRVKEGRWSVVGGWWEQPDCNIPCGESFVRHELYGKRYFLDRFGLDVDVGYNADSFGHNAGLPQILAKAGIRYYVFMRPGPHEKELPGSMFYWEGPDGSRVLAHRLHAAYGTGPSEIAEHIMASAASRPEGSSVAACFYGVGNHGGGPTIENIRCIERLRQDPSAPTLVFGTLGEMFEHAQAQGVEFPVVKGDLQHHAVGCYTAHSDIKMWNRRAENALISAEKLCVLAKLAAGRAFPKEEFAAAWQRVLLSQFHDILAGTSLEVAYEDVRDWLGAAVESADYETITALSHIASRIDTRGEGRPFVVFNPHAQAVTCPIHFDTNANSLRDHTGRPVPVQTAAPVFEHTGGRVTKVFVDTLPPLGYKLYYASRGDQTAAGVLRAAGSTIENDFYRIELDPRTGEIRQMTDTRVPVELLSSAAGAIVLRDDSDTWSHGVTAFRDVVGRFGDAKIELVENGPVRATLRIESRFGGSTLWQDLSLYAQLPMIELGVTIDWHERHRMLKFEFPLAVEDPISTYDAAYAVVTHPTDGAENPGQRWIDVTGTLAGRPYGVGLVNNARYGFDVEGSVMRLSALRSPIYAFHDPRRVEPGKRYRYMDQGLHTFRFALIPHEGRWQDAGVAREALLMNMPPVAVESHRHSGDRPGEHSFGSISAPNVDLCAMKEAEDDDSLIARLYETSGSATDAVLTLGPHEYPVRLSPFELKTLKLLDGRAVDVDPIEREM